MIVTAKRLGWDEQLTAEQEYDMAPYEESSDDLEGELLVKKIPARPEHPAFTVHLVGGHEADPKTIKPKE